MGERFHFPLHWKPFVAGSVAGLGNVLVGHPLDTLKVRIQTAVRGVVCYSLHRQPLYAGVSAPLLTVPLLAGVNFGIWDTVRIKLTLTWPGVFARGGAGQRGDLNAVDSGAMQETATSECAESASSGLSIYLAGFASGWVVSHATCPMQNLKLQQQTAGSALGLAMVARRSGVRGLYRGYVPHALAESFGRGCYMLGFVVAKRALGVDTPRGSQKGSTGSGDVPKRVLCGSDHGRLGG